MISFARPLTLCLAAVFGDGIELHIQPYLQWPEPAAITIMWETNQPALGEVQYGLTPDLGMRSVEKAARGVHELRLTGLDPHTLYFYRVKCGGLLSEVKSFRTAPGPDVDRWRLIAYGDSRSFPDRHQRVAELASRLEPELVLHTGDQVANGTQRGQWKEQFFDPAAKLFGRVPVLTSLGNHEQKSGNYFEYLALPGKEQYYSLDFGNAHIVVLDSNTWGTSARDSEQYQWLREDLSQKRPTRWTVVGFHHPLFSAHDKRAINPARWDWCPLLEDMGMDLVLTGHDHFYCRTWPIGRVGETGSRGIPHITTAGGGAPLYQLKERSYTAAQKAVHHCTVLDFTSDEIRGKVIDLEGNVFDQFTVSKNLTPPAEFSSYEVFELERALRQEIESRPPTVVPEDAKTVAIDDELRIRHTFRVPVNGRIKWQEGAGAKTSEESPVNLKPGEPLVIPIKYQVILQTEAAVATAKDSARLARMKLEFIDDRFRNREIEFGPIKIWRDLTVRSKSIARSTNTRVPSKGGKPSASGPYHLVRSDGAGPAAVRASVLLTHTADRLTVTTTLQDPHTKVKDGETAASSPDAAALMKVHHLRMLLAADGHVYSFVVTPEGRRATGRDSKPASVELDWSAVARRKSELWTIEITLPRKFLATSGEWRINLVHADPATGLEDCLSPTFDAGTDPDRVPDIRFGDQNAQRFARLVLE